MRIHPSIYPCHWLVVRSFIWRIVLWNHFDRRLEKQQSEKRKQWKVILGPGGLPATVTYWERKLLVGKHRCGTVVGSQAWPRKNPAVQNTIDWITQWSGIITHLFPPKPSPDVNPYFSDNGEMEEPAWCLLDKMTLDLCMSCMICGSWSDHKQHVTANCIQSFEINSDGNQTR